jgi:hypothetical protein
MSQIRVARQCHPTAAGSRAVGPTVHALLSPLAAALPRVQLRATRNSSRLDGLAIHDGLWLELRVGTPVYRGEELLFHGTGGGWMLVPPTDGWLARFPEFGDFERYVDVVSGTGEMTRR